MKTFFLSGNKLKNMEWISVIDRLPEKDTNVIYYDKNKYMYIGCLMSDMGKEIYWSHYDFLEDKDVTHWMPLPKAPSSETDLFTKENA